MARGTIYCKQMEIDHIKRIAHICGPSSGAAKALEDYEAKKSAGKDVFIYDVVQNNQHIWLVAPKLVEHDMTQDEQDA